MCISIEIVAVVVVIVVVVVAVRMNQYNLKCVHTIFLVHVNSHRADS